MKRSPELEALAERAFSVFNEGDFLAIRNLMSRQDGTFTIGSDPREMYTGFEANIAILEKQAAEQEALPAESGPRGGSRDIRGYQVGDAGWATVVQQILRGDGTESWLRVTFVFELENAQWKIVHEHWSRGVRNEETFGLEMTTSLEDLATAVDEERPDVSDATAADGTVTLLFTDVESSTALLSDIGDHRYKDLSEWHNGVVRRAVAQHGGHEVSWQGDGFVLAFGSARRAVQCAAGIQDVIAAGPPDGLPLIRVRMGLHTGEALRDRDAFYGHVVHFAARVAASAVGGQILTSGVVRHLLAGDTEWRFGPPLEREFKGFAGPNVVHEVTRA